MLPEINRETVHDYWADEEERIKRQDKPLENDRIGNMIPSLLIRGPLGIPSAARSAWEIFKHLVD